MEILTVASVLLMAYLLGSIPFGWVVVKLSTGKDVRHIESGRTGGTNVWRAAGLLPGLITAVLDALKAAASVWLVRAIVPDSTPFFHWIEIAAPLLAIVGHNYSIYLIETHQTTGRMRLRGGAGGAACLGGALGLWSPAAWIALPLIVLVYFVVGYASLTTMSIALSVTVIFAISALQGVVPWQYIIYGLVAELLLVWSLRPNLERLRQGNERIHGLRPWLKKRAAAKRQA